MPLVLLDGTEIQVRSRVHTPDGKRRALIADAEARAAALSRQTKRERAAYVEQRARDAVAHVRVLAEHGPWPPDDDDAYINVNTAWSQAWERGDPPWETLLRNLIGAMLERAIERALRAAKFRRRTLRIINMMMQGKDKWPAPRMLHDWPADRLASLHPIVSDRRLVLAHGRLQRLFQLVKPAVVIAWGETPPGTERAEIPQEARVMLQDAADFIASLLGGPDHPRTWQEARARETSLVAAIREPQPQRNEGETLTHRVLAKALSDTPGAIKQRIAKARAFSG